MSFSQCSIEGKYFSFARYNESLKSFIYEFPLAGIYCGSSFFENAAIPCVSYDPCHHYNYFYEERLRNSSSKHAYDSLPVTIVW
jgi:hypothetical protein